MYYIDPRSYLGPDRRKILFCTIKSEKSDFTLCARILHVRQVPDVASFHMAMFCWRHVMSDVVPCDTICRASWTMQIDKFDMKTAVFSAIIGRIGEPDTSSESPLNGRYGNHHFVRDKSRAGDKWPKTYEKCKHCGHFCLISNVLCVPNRGYCWNKVTKGTLWYSASFWDITERDAWHSVDATCVSLNVVAVISVNVGPNLKHGSIVGVKLGDLFTVPLSQGSE